MNLSDNIGLPTTRITITWLLSGLCCGLLLYGVMLCQGYSYFQTYYRKDPLDLKLAVAAILITNAVILGLNTYACFYYAVDLLSCTSGTTDTLFYVPTCLVIAPLCILFSIVLCEYIYIRRTYFIIYMHPQGRYFLVINSVILVASATGFVTALTVNLATQPNFQRWLEVNWLVSAGFGCSVVGDVGLAFVLSFALHASRTGLERTDALLNSIISNAFKSGIVTSLVSITCLLVAVFEGTTLAIIPLSLVGAKIYASATLVTLNIRQDMSEKLAAPGGSELLGVSLRFNNVPQQSGQRGETSGEDIRAPIGPSLVLTSTSGKATLRELEGQPVS